MTDVASQKRGKPWNLEEESALWKLRRRGMEFDEIAVSETVLKYSEPRLRCLTLRQKQIDRTERGCYDRFNKLRNEGFGRGR